MNRICAAFVLFLGSLSAFSGSSNGAYSVDWTREASSPNSDFGRTVTVDLDGNAFLIGHTDGSLEGPNAGRNDPYLIKYDSAGNKLWGVQDGSLGYDLVNGATTDSGGNVYVVGRTRGALEGPIIGYWDAYLSKFDADGNKLWGKQVGGLYYDEATDVAVDSSGNIYLVGLTDGPFVTKYDSAGTQLWTRPIGTADYDIANAIAIDPFGGVVIAGSTDGDLGGINAGGADVFLARFEANGALDWTRQLGTTEYETIHSIAIDAAGNAFATGVTRGDLEGTNAGANDGFLMKVDVGGNHLWTQQFGTTTDDFGRGIALDPAGNPLVAGYTFGSLEGPNAGYSDLFLTKFDANGQHLEGYQIGTADYEFVEDVAFDTAGNAYVGGHRRFEVGSSVEYDAQVVKFVVPEPTALLIALANAALIFMRRERQAGHAEANRRQR